MSDVERLRTWLSRAAPARFDLVKALFMASVASVAGTGLFVGALALLVVSSGRPGLRAIAIFLLAIELVAFLRSPLRFGERMSTHRLGFSAVAHWRQWLMGTVGNWDYSRWQRFATGDLLERSLSDTEELQDLWLRGVIPSVAALVTMALSDLAVGVLAPRSRWWIVAVATLALQLILVAILAVRLGAQARADRLVRERRAAYVATLVSSRAAAPEIARLGATDFLRRRERLLITQLAHAEDVVRRARQRDGVVVVAGPLLALSIVALAHPASAGVWIIVAGMLSVATFDTLAILRASVRVAVAVIGGAERLDDLAVPETNGSSPWPVEATLVFRDVAVAQSRNGPRLVSGVIPPGRRVGVSGPSGSGKSTLLRALARLDDSPAGEISLGGRGIHDLDEAQLRAHVTLVPSEPGLVRGFVRDVLGMGREVTDQDVDSLAALGLRVERNDAWKELSRGERQRVALVRALVRQPDILLLDEPTSALGDAETTAVLDLLSSSSATVIVATHDPRVLAWCEDVIEIGR